VDKTWEFSSGSESKIWNNGTSQAANKMRPTPCTRYITAHAGAQNGLVSGVSSVLVSATKLECHDLMNG
jgi:hypothetical protein